MRARGALVVLPHSHCAFADRRIGSRPATGYDALQRALERNGRPGLIDGFAPEHRHFIAFAQTFRGHERDESFKTRVTTDPHSPDKWRVNGPLSNSEMSRRPSGARRAPRWCVRGSWCRIFGECRAEAVNDWNDDLNG